MTLIAMAPMMPPRAPPALRGLNERTREDCDVCRVIESRVSDVADKTTKRVRPRASSPIPSPPTTEGDPYVSDTTEAPRWEYFVTPLLLHNEAQILNNWGAQGWELVQIIEGPAGGNVAYLKRKA
jgi:hypothetical protein